MSIEPTEKVLNSIAKVPSGLTLAQLQAMHPHIARRTMQRWIGNFIDEGKIRALGEGRARRYVPAQEVSNSISDSKTRNDAFPEFIPLSVEARDILRYVARPLAARKPVGYQRELLDDYHPNKNGYLPASTRKHLRRIGNTGESNQPAGTYGRAVLDRLLIDLSWASSHLEGNTYSLLDTRRLIEQGKAARGKAAIETQMILNHKVAIELLIDNADTTNFDRYTLFNLHSALSENLLPNPADEGRIRPHTVEIGNSVYHPVSVPAQLGELFDLLLQKAGRIDNPFEQSFFIMVHLPYLQPFADVNKRTSRLAANIPLIKANVCPLTFLDVPPQAYIAAMLGVYELGRIELLRDVYVWAYERSTQAYLAIRQELAEPDPLRMQYRDVIKQCVRSVVQHPNRKPATAINNVLKKHVEPAHRDEVNALIGDELGRLHEGVLARYGLKPSEYLAWQNQRSSKLI